MTTINLIIDNMPTYIALCQKLDHPSQASPELSLPKVNSAIEAFNQAVVRFPQLPIHFKIELCPADEHCKELFCSYAHDASVHFAALIVSAGRIADGS